MAIYNKSTGLLVRSGDGTVRNNTASIYKPWDPSSIIDRIKEEEQSRSSSLPTYNGSFRIGASAPQLQFEEPIQIGKKKDTTPTQIYEEATEKVVITPSRLADIITGAAKSTAGGYASALGTTQAVTGGAARKNYLTRDIEQWQKELETYRYQAKNATDAEERKYFLLEAGKTANKIEAAKQNLLETETAGQSMQQMAKKLSASAQQDIREAKQGLGKVGSFLVDTGVAGAQMLGDVAVGALTGGSALPSMFVRSAGSSAQEARDAGGTLGQQVAYGLGSGALSVATEKLSNVAAPFKKAFGAGLADDILEKVAKKPMGKAIMAALSEGGEELAEAILQPALKMATYDRDAIYDDDWFADAVYSAAIGAVMGGVGGAGEVVVSRAAQKGAESKMPSAETQAAAKAGTDATAQEGTAEGLKTANEPVRVGRVTTLKNPYQGTKPIQGEKNAATVTVDSGSVETARNRIQGARNLETGSAGTTSFKAALKNAYKSVFKPAKGVPVDGVTFEGQQYTVDINSNVPGKVISDPNLSAEKLALLDILPNVVKNGTYVGSGDYVQHGTKKKLTVRFDYFETPVVINGKQYVAAFDVEVFPNTNNYRTYKLNKIELSPIANADAGPAPAASAAETAPIESTRPLNYDNNITQDADSVNKEGGLGTVRNDSLGSARGGFDPFTAAQNQYGTLPEGENAVRPDDVPVSTNGRDRVSRSVVTAKGAAVTPDEFVPLLENQTIKGQFSFYVKKNSKTVQQAMERITDDGWDGALRRWFTDVGSGKGDEVLVAEGAILYNNALNSQNYQLAMDIFAEYQGLVRTGARMTQAARILKSLSPENRLYLINKDIQKLVDRLALSQKITLPNNLVQAYMAAKTDADVNNAVGDIQQYVADQLPSTGVDLWTSLRYTNMLGNFKTPIRNVIGNVAMRALSELENSVAALGQTITGGKYGKTRSVLVNKDMMRAAKADSQNVEGLLFNEAKYTLSNQSGSAFLQGVKDRQTVFKQDISLFGKEFSLPEFTAPVLNVMEGYRKATDSVMNNEIFGDKAFMRSAYARALGGYLQANGYTAQQLSDAKWREINQDVLDKARTFAIKQAQEVTFRDRNWLSEFASSFLRGNKTPAWMRAGGEGILPFRATPANVLYRAEEYSPLGFVNAAVNTVRAATGSEAVSGADVIENLSKALTGSGVLVVGMYLARMGFIRGADDDDEKQAAFDDLTGHQSYSVELPDGTSFTLDWLSPVAMPLFMGAELEQLRQEDGNISFGDLISAVASNSGPMVQMSMLQGVNDVLNDIKYADDAGLERIVITSILNYFTQGLTNSLLSQIERTFEGQSTMTYADKTSEVPTWLQKELGAASRKVPGIDYSQVPYIDAWGREEDKGDAAERIFNNFFNPAYVSQWDVDEVERELQRVKDAAGSTSVFPDRAEKSVTIGGEARALTAEQYVEYAKALGQERYKMAKEATSSSAYKAMSDADKASCIAKLYSVARAKSLKAIFPDYEPSAELAGYLDAEKEGITPVEFYAFRAGISGAGSDEESTRQEKVMANINAMDISRKEKDFLFYLKYPKGDAGNAPWN